MIHFDATKLAGARHRSGLVRMGGRLLEELGAAAAPVRWDRWDRAAAAGDWFLTAEQFSEAERPGLGELLARRPCRCAAIFADAIPLKHPRFTWPQSVARHPEYMKLLARFDRVWAISRASREELLGYWRWLGVAAPPPVEVLPLGADFRAGVPRALPAAAAAPARFLCVGIIEPRKNQALLLDVCEELWAEGLEFELHLAGRVNPAFGRPLARRLRSLARRRPGLRHHENSDDAGLLRLYAEARATLVPTLAEGCGLPLLESLWLGVPVVCGDLPVLMENAAGGGCVPVKTGDRAAWGGALRRLVLDLPWRERLAGEAGARPLSTWAESARILREAMVSPD